MNLKNFEGKIMRSKIITLMLSAALTASVITGCGNSATENTTGTTSETTTETATETTAYVSANNEQVKAATATSYEDLVASLHAGQFYAYAPIYEGENALLVTSYTFDDLAGHQGTYEATIFIEKSNSIEKVTTVQSGGTAYPIAITDDNSLILSMHDSVLKGYVSKDTGKFVIAEEANADYSSSEDGIYHNYKAGAIDITADSSLYDELSEKYFTSEVLSFTKAGVSSDGTPNLSGAVYAAYKGDNLYNVSSYYIFEDETSGSTETTDGISGLPFTYELSGENIVFHFASADDNSEAKFAWDNTSYPTITFTGNNETISLLCLGNEDPKVFDAVKYYDNDNNLFMQVKSFDETTFTGDLYREERINAEYVDNAEENSIIYSINGTPFTVVSFEEANKEVKYGTDEEFKKDIVGTTRYADYLVKCGDDDSYYALEKEDYATEYKVVYMFNEGNIRKLIEENVTFRIKENCEIILQKFVEDGEFGNLKQERIIGREFKGDNYPGWSQDAKEYYLTSDMLVALGVIDGELYNVVQIYVP